MTRHPRFRVRPTDDEGIAMVLALLFMLAFSSLGAAVLVLSRTETFSSLNYRMMSQARYGAESGVHKAAHYLLNAYPLPGSVNDPLANYDTTVSPVTYLGQPVVLSAIPNVDANYPVAAIQTAFAAAAAGTLPAGQLDVAYTATATLLSMRDVIPYGATTATVVQTWELTARGAIAGARTAEVEVSAILERQVIPAHTYAAFATDRGCGALEFSGGVISDSYDSSNMTIVNGKPVTDPHTGHVGTNGNLTEAGGSLINGTLSTPRSGVGNCSEGNVTALTMRGNGQVTGGISSLPQAVAHPTPAAPSPAPPTSDIVISSSATCATFLLTSGMCTAGSGNFTLTPSDTMTLANVKVTAGTTLTLNAGTYNINSLSLTGNSRLVIGSGPVILNVAGTGENTPIDFVGGTIVNPDFDPSMFRIVYGGTGALLLSGGSATATIVYAPNAHARVAGGADFYGSILADTIDIVGGSKLHYDRKLKEDFFTIGPQMMSAFTWRAQ